MKWFLTPSTAHLLDGLVGRGAKPGGYDTVRFSDGERGYRLTGDVNGQAVTLLGSVTPDPASLFDLFALFRLLVENGSQRPGWSFPIWATRARIARSSLERAAWA